MMTVPPLVMIITVSLHCATGVGASALQTASAGAFGISLAATLENAPAVSRKKKHGCSCSFHGRVCC